MNEKKYRGLLYFIITTIILTIAVQCFWNYKNYQQNKQQFINEVQISLDNALDIYYANLAKDKKVFINIDTDTLVHDSVFFKTIKLKHHGGAPIDVSKLTQVRDSSKSIHLSKSNTVIKIHRNENVSDSLKILKEISSIFVSIHDDSLNFSKLNPLLINEFERKKINIPFALKHFKNDSLFHVFNDSIIKTNFLKTTSKTKFLKESEALELLYPNATRIILYRGLSGIILSLLLSVSIIACLLYLLKIIKHQKQLAEVKNDLISNITHEFKTPIATIGVALESIKNFNVIDNKEKTKSYLDMSNEQLIKLNVMVEKLLETATLDSENLNLNKEHIDISKLFSTLVNKHKLQTETKTIKLTFPPKTIFANVDIFHFENTINNILDNAIKYGGNSIEVNLLQNSSTFNISISDNGNSISSSNKDKIFEKFYRIPKGNTHDVKGFGIGLYYAKKITEKHGGTIHLNLDNGLTTFKISIPNE